jgi:hypothetical protein
MPRAAGAPPAALPFLYEFYTVRALQIKPARRRRYEATCQADSGAVVTSIMGIQNYNEDKTFLRGRLVPAWPGRAGPFGSAAVATADARGNDPGDGNYRVSEVASAGEVLAAAEHCGVAHCNCCKVLLPKRRHAASGHGPGTPD